MNPHYDRSVKLGSKLTDPRYGNQVEAAQGLKKAFTEIPGLKREDIFIVRFPLLFFNSVLANN
jgi:hypothetical protein